MSIIVDRAANFRELLTSHGFKIKTTQFPLLKYIKYISFNLQVLVFSIKIVLELIVHGFFRTGYDNNNNKGIQS